MNTSVIFKNKFYQKLDTTDQHHESSKHQKNNQTSPHERLAKLIQNFLSVNGSMELA